MSYDGQVNFGLIGDYDGMPDLEDLAQDIEASIAELIELVGGRPGILRRFLPGEGGATATRNGGGEREESPAG
jgi:hypothetical protein